MALGSYDYFGTFGAKGDRTMDGPVCLLAPGSTPTTLKSSIQYRPAIDGLKAVAVLAVFIFHLKHE
jgi:hypothetical protein